MPVPSCGPEVRKKGTSAPSSDASSCRRSGGSGSARVSLASLSAVAASELPDPRVPARVGVRGLGQPLERGSDERVLGEAFDPELGRRLDREAVGQVDPLQDRGDLVATVVAEGPDD